MPRSKSPSDPFEPLDDAFDVPAFIVPLRPTSRASQIAPTSPAPSESSRANRPTTNRPTTDTRSATSRPLTNSGRPPANRPLSNDSRSGEWAAAINSFSNRSSSRPDPAPRMRNPPRARWAAARPMRAVHFQIGGVLLVALGAILGWNTLAPHTDGVLPRWGVWLLRQALGSGAPLVPLAVALCGCLLIARGPRARAGAFWRGALLGFAVFAAVRHLSVPRGHEFESVQTLQHFGGIIGAAVSWTLRRVLGEVGTYIALIALGLASLLLWSEGTLSELSGQIGEKWANLRHKWKSGAAKPKSPKPERQAPQPERQAPQDDRHCEPASQERAPEPRPQTPRGSNGSARRAAHSPFLEVGDWFGTQTNESDAQTANDPAKNSLDKSETAKGQSQTLNDAGQTVQGMNPTLNDAGQTNGDNDQISNDTDEISNGMGHTPANPRQTAQGADEPKGKDKPASARKTPAPTEAPRIEIIQAELPVSVLDLNQQPDEVLLPHEALELQALESAQHDADVAKPRRARIEKPRRRFGDGPLMPEYFDDGVRALDPPILPDLEGAEEELQRGVIGVQETLAAFKIDARVTDVKRGPVITRYEVQPAPGVRVAAIANLDKDLARSLSALAVRIEAPVPGKNVVGIEVPNKRVHLVRMRDVLEQHDFLSHPSKLAFVLGKDIAGQPKWGDLQKMPHMLIAGSTNSGKSVCLNSIIASILVRSGPEEVRFSLIDPKRVELTLYRGIPHLMHDVVVEPKQAVVALRRAIEEMDRRYKLFASRGVRNIASYNSKLQAGERPMPYIVIVIDELADLMMTAAAEFEKLICRLAQLARATGIHLIVATQRPSVNVITGVIKANIPARVAFAVASQVDSRTILDAVGAERLIGSGDMLFDANNGGKSTRIQGAYLSEEEVNRIVEVVKANYAHEDSVPDDLPTFDLFVEDEDDSDDAKSGGFSSDEKRDSLFDDIVEFALRHQEMSASNIQRKFGIGYPRAGRIVDQLERAGILGPADGPKARKVLGRGDTGGSSRGEDE